MVIDYNAMKEIVFNTSIFALKTSIIRDKHITCCSTLNLIVIRIGVFPFINLVLDG